MNPPFSSFANPHPTSSSSLLVPSVPAAARAGSKGSVSSAGFELEEALFSTAPVGVHCIDSQGILLWANRTELDLLGYSESEYLGRYVSSFVYSPSAVSGSGTGGARGTTGGSAGGGGAGGGDQIDHADEKTLYNVIVKQIATGNAVRDVPVRFVARNGLVHFLVDCDGRAIPRRSPPGASSPSPSSSYFRCFTRDDTSRQIQEMRSNVLFQETNRSLQMLDNFMNRSLHLMRSPLRLMQKACELVGENIEDVDEVVRSGCGASGCGANGGGKPPPQAPTARNLRGFGGDEGADAAQHQPQQQQSLAHPQTAAGTQRPSNLRNTGGRPKPPPHQAQAMIEAATVAAAATAAPEGGGGHVDDHSAAIALSAASEARSVVTLASTLVRDASALVDDIADLCRFDQGQALAVEKEAVKVRDMCLEALRRVRVPPSSARGCAVSLNIEEGAPGRAMTDRAVLLRCLSLLLDFAVDAATGASGAAGAGRSGAGYEAKVVLSVSVAENAGQQPGSESSCKISVSYSNPVAYGTDTDGDGSIAAMGGGGRDGGGLSQSQSADVFHQQFMAPGDQASGGTLPPIFRECYTKPPNFGEDEEFGLDDHDLHYQHHYGWQNQRAMPGSWNGARGGGGSMMRKVRLRESIERGMTRCRRDKLGLGLSLLYHLVGAQGGDLRHEMMCDYASMGEGKGETYPSFWFLLPMSLDFPERLSAESIVKDELQPRKRTIPASFPDSSSSHSSFAATPDENLDYQQPPKKKIRFSGVGGQSMPTEPSNSGSKVASADPANVVDGTTGDEAASVAESPGKGVAEKRYPGVAPGARPLVLVAEDTDVSASLLCMHLRKLNCTSHRAENGEVALEMLRSAPTPNMYSLVLMDLRMPVMDGFEAASIIKGSLASNIPVVALTGETSEENRRKCDEIGFDDYKTKPLKRPQLRELLNKFVPGYQGPS